MKRAPDVQTKGPCPSLFDFGSVGGCGFGIDRPGLVGLGHELRALLYAAIAPI